MRWIDSRTLRLNVAEARAMQKFEQALDEGTGKQDAIEQIRSMRDIGEEFIAYLGTRPERAGVKFSEGQMLTIASHAEATYHPAGDPPYVCLLAGRGEVQLDTEGNAYYLNWDRTHAVDDVVDLEVPKGTLKEIADWFVDQARRYQDR